MSRSISALILFTACASSSAPPPPASVSRTGLRERQMENCPSSVRGATTSLELLADGVELRITAEELDARHEIEQRADMHLRMGDPAGQAPEHTGLHGGPGSMGHCPIVHDATTIAVRRLPDGVAIRVRAMSPDAVKWLQEEVRTRVAGLRVQR